MAGARTSALKALLRVDQEQGYSNLVLDSELEKEAFPSRDRALVSALFYGVLEKRVALDYQLGFYSKYPLRKLSPTVREILRLGLYQLRFMGRIPPSAAVNESVKLAKENGEYRAAGFVNAVLRSAQREPERVKLPDPEREPVFWRSVFYSCPEKLIYFWRKGYGNELTDEILRGISQKPELFVRVNNLRTTPGRLAELFREAGCEAEPALWPDGALCLKNAGDIRNSQLFSDGLYHVQDLSSQLCCSILSPKPGEHVADVCAAPGGKAFTIAERMENRGTVEAFDLYPARVGLIESGARRLGISIIHAAVRDASRPGDAAAEADRVLCDAPCSGLGVIRRKPEIRHKFMGSIDSLPDLQYRILCNSSACVKSGGILVYSTCTLNPAENGEVADKFLRENGGFEPLSVPLPDGIRRRFSEPEHQLTLFPQAGGSDGFFVSAFRRK